MSNDNARQVAKVLGRIAICGALLMIPRVLHVEYVSGGRKNESVGYYDAVRAIMNTNMFASDKRKAVSVMKRDGSTEYYKSVISIVNTNMFASDKIEMIETLN